MWTTWPWSLSLAGSLTPVSLPSPTATVNNACFVLILCATCAWGCGWGSLRGGKLTEPSAGVSCQGPPAWGLTRTHKDRWESGGALYFPEVVKQTQPREPRRTTCPSPSTFRTTPKGATTHPLSPEAPTSWVGSQVGREGCLLPSRTLGQRSNRREGLECWASLGTPQGANQCSWSIVQCPFPPAPCREESLGWGKEVLGCHFHPSTTRSKPGVAPEHCQNKTNKTKGK